VYGCNELICGLTIYHATQSEDLTYFQNTPKAPFALKGLEQA
jgi:hypothetical protein